MTNIQDAEKTIGDLIQKRTAAEVRLIDIATQRRANSFAAHADGDAKAKKVLDALAIDTVKATADLESLDAALAVARERLASAQAAAAIEADRVQALELREKLAKFKELGERVDDACWDLSKSLNEMIAALHEIHVLGQASPTAEIFRVNGVMAIKTMLQSLPQSWVSDFEFQRLQPVQKKSMKGLADGWATMIERNVSARLGDDNSAKQEAA